MAVEYINPQIHLNDYLAVVKAELRQEIDSLRALPVDQPSLVRSLLDKYYIGPLVLGQPKPSAAVDKTVERQYMSNKYTVQVSEIKVTIPYSGAKILFNCKPATYTRVYPKQRHALYSNLITVFIELEQLDSDQFDRELQSFIAEISVNLERTNMQLSFFNDGLQDLITSLVAKKSEELVRKLDFMEKIGLNVNPKSDVFMVPTPVVRKAIPQPVTETSPGMPRNYIPTLQTQVYNDIREVLYNVGRAIERKPSLYKGKREEDLRDIFLLFLETRYDATAGVGEAFNKSGKTDILLKYAGDGSNIFVAECKFWKGQKQFFQAIDQLLGYLTHRDAKTALMIFVKQQDLSAVTETVRHSTPLHPQFRRFVNASYNTSFAFELALPGDAGSTLAMEFMLFHFPA